MSILRSNLLGCLSAIVLCTAATAATVVPVAPVPGSTATNVFGINDSNVIAGSFIDGSGVEHGFFGPANGTYTTLDAGSGGTQARGINNDGYIVGFSNSQDGDSSSQPNFERLPDGTMQTVQISGQPVDGQANGIANGTNKFVGGRWAHLQQHLVAYLGSSGHWHRDINVQALHESTEANGINTHDDIVGDYTFPPTHGFIENRSHFAIVDYPGDTEGTTSLNGINDRGHAVGQWLDTSGNWHSFLFDKHTATFTDIKVKGAASVQAWGINTAGAVSVTTDIGSFIWCKKASSCPAGGTPVEAPQRISPASVRTVAAGR
jgi:hypothetical protein